MSEFKATMDSLTEIQEELNKEREEIWKALEFIRSLRSVINFTETGNPYPDDEVY